MLLSVALPLACVSASAQTGRGSIAGSVTDGQGGSLQGAKISLQPSQATAESNATGQFSMIGVPAGEYTITVSYAGFDTYTGQVTVQAGQVAHFTSALKVASAKSSVQVYAGREGGELEAINRMFTADNIINVLPADVIKSLPNANVADAIGRLPSVSLERDEGEGKYVQIRGTEPRLTNVMVDGVNIASAETVRQIKLDIIPSDLVESVQINKTLQANMPGDGIGGSVDLRTKSAEDRPTIRLEATGGHTNIIGGRPAYQFDGDAGKRFFNGKLGVLADLSYDWNGRGINDVEPGPLYLGGYDERDYRYYRSRFGVAGTIDYRASDNSSVYLKYLYSLFHNYGDRWDYNFGVAFNPDFTPTPGSGQMTFGAERRRPIQDLGLVQLGGNHIVNSYVIHWDVESSLGRTRDVGYDDAYFNNGNNYTFNVDNSNPLIPKITAPGQNVYDPTQYTLTRLRINNYYNPEVDLGFGGSVAHTYSAGGHSSTIEIGGRFRNVHKFANQDTLNRTPANSNLTIASFPSDFSDPHYYRDNYVFGPAANFDAILAQQFVPDTKHGDLIGNNFNYIEKVSAAYIMDTINLGKWRLVGGVRFEETNTHDAGTTIPGAPTVSNSGSYLSVLPSVAVRYGFTPSSGLRAVYSRGVSRPNFSDIVSFASIAPGGVRTTSSVGNPNLKAEGADNFDLLYEQNLSPIGLLQGGFFYKHLSNPIVPLQQLFITPDPSVAGKQDYNYLTQAQNGGSAYVTGLEIGFQQHMTYLPGFLNGFGISANYAYTKSQLTFPAQIALPSDPSNPNGGTQYNLNRTDKPALLRQAPHTWNVSPTYDKRGFSARLGLTYNAANIFSYSGGVDNTAFVPVDANGNGGTGGGLNGPNGDQYLYAHLQVDLQGSYRLPKGFEVIGYGLNLNNEVFGFYNGNPNDPVQREFYQPTFGGGLRWSPHRE